ncbi:hypothetical protein [Mycolicibacterium sphagni]|uniref:hypothetical protein n=1 Tax=Mycolicibacterium sphagni TaxID=1786 RepID=UPI0021F258E0|nr:hypothetical protein [Mycolicibacterium sphagni]MCV7174846.1 hypothetical protein [Mycolicibacterium sphagni]
MSDDEKRAVMNRANEIGLVYGSIRIPVQVGGCRNDFAGVTVKSGAPLAGFSAEYSWEAIRRVVENGGVLR